MALPKLKEILGSAVAVGMMLTPLAAADAQQPNAQPVAVSTTNVNFPMRDARNAGENSVRFATAQVTKAAPAIALLGVQRESWPRIRGAIQQAIADGYPVGIVVMGPTDAEPALEIYAKGVLVTNPINPNTYPPEKLTQLIRDVNAEMYPRQLASRSEPSPH
ncbi:hypothetical protein J3E64_001552 [Sphingobium sp. OAS761]|uniref:hypothetical protein n=1 Tax=Sphingobium sp. OAS761 TaxID=2817901 RepID=UPI0020A1E5BF|nr:hypothetical protein [Sphingobium sp. OAS761]MCP1469870.1 hypothetical protein [Sphingobium sp. OAS761]